MGAYLFDIIIVALLALFAWRGATKGLILSLCGLAAIFAAYLGRSEERRVGKECL